jgi:folate-binding Fe-S cluster repair protein YgfZ
MAAKHQHSSAPQELHAEGCRGGQCKDGALMIIGHMMTSPLRNTRRRRAPDRTWGVIRAAGADAASFLHSQLTQDFALLDRSAGAPGRLLLGQGPAAGDFVGWKRRPDEILLLLQPRLLPAR